MNKLRFRSGQVQLRKLRVDANSQVTPGDLLWLDGNVARPASEFAWDTDLATTQGSFASEFVGIAHQASGVGETLPVSVDVGTQSVYEMDVSPAAYEFGQPLGPDENLSTLMNKQLETCLATNAIARSAEFTAGTVATLRVTFASAFSTSSSNSQAAVG
ncbi:hypothetical protein AB1L42_16160 [Thalassoglobus sp. JC818]|uniref:hypothetical protein n=1 Tax=Thalassoglobus sp. JC818 TaxID=3232136 RepID=UPI00345A7CCD